MKIKLLQVPVYWTPASLHWYWAAEMINRHLSDDFEIFTTTDIYQAEEEAKKCDIMLDWYVTRYFDWSPFHKMVGVVHSVSELQHVNKPFAARGVISKRLHALKNNDENIHVVPYGIDTDFFSPFRKTNQKDKLVVGWVGNPETKHLDILLNAVKGLPVELNIVDNSVHPQALFSMANYYNTVDLIVVSSLAEGLCRPILEAAACGRPVISTPVGIAEEILDPEYILPLKTTLGAVNEGKPAISKKMKAVIEKFIGDRSLVETVGQRNRQEVLDNWTWEKRIVAWENMLKAAYEKVKETKGGA